MPSYRIQYALDDLDNPEPLIARTDLILAANMPVGERMVKIEMERYQERSDFASWIALTECWHRTALPSAAGCPERASRN